MNAVLMLVRNSLELTKRAVASVLAQDIPVTLYVIDNDSTDGTFEWLGGCTDASTQFGSVRNWRMTPAKGVSASWNFGLDYLFNTAQCEHVLVLNNDLVLKPETYRSLLEDGGDFVTAVSVDNLEGIQGEWRNSRRNHPDYSCYLIRRKVWDTVGKFDESMVHYASDGDYHLRMHQAGIDAYTIGIPFFHVASGTLKTADPDEKTKIMRQADMDRAAFERKWKVKIGSPEYYRLFNGTEP